MSCQITVITPVFNGENYIRETIESVLSAINREAIEYIVVNDGSSDNTLAILTEYSGRINILTHPNSGESASVNAGLQKAQGNLILIVNADDPLISSSIFNGVEKFFELNQHIVAWYPDWQMIDSKGKVLKVIEVDEYSEDALIGEFKCLPGPGTIFRKSAALQIGGRNSRWKFVGDYDFWLRLSQHGQFEKRSGVLAQWRFHSNSTSISNRNEQMASERISVIENFLDDYSISDKLRRKALSHAYYFAARLVFFDPNIEGRRLLVKAFKLRRGFIEGANAIVTIYILTMPVSSFIYAFFRPWLKRFKKFEYL